MIINSLCPGISPPEVNFVGGYLQILKILVIKSLYDYELN
jgi:hypothetical protein